MGQPSAGPLNTLRSWRGAWPRKDRAAFLCCADHPKGRWLLAVDEQKHELIVLKRRRNSLEVIIEDWCIGCGLCARNCPYGNINLHPFEVMAEDPEHAGRKKAAVKQKATSCDLCTHLKEPSCVYACPHDAAHRVDPRKFFTEIAEQSK